MRNAIMVPCPMPPYHAKWARFFTLLGWQWEYKPRPFDKWEPTFVLRGARQSVFVYACHSTIFEPLLASVIDGSDCGVEVLIVGARITLNVGMDDSLDVPPPLGWLREQNPETLEWVWQAAHFGSFGGIGFHVALGSYHNRITGEHDGARKTFTNPRTGDEIDQMWTKASIGC